MADPPFSPPGFILTSKFHIFFPLWFMLKRSGHSHTPPCAPISFPNSLSFFQFFKLAEEKKLILSCVANVIIHFLPSLYQLTFGSRKSLMPGFFTTGLPEYFFHDLPLSTLYAML